MSIERVRKINGLLEDFCRDNYITFQELDAWFVSVTSARFRLGNRPFEEYETEILKNLAILEKIW